MVQQEAVIDDRELSNIRAEYWFRITVLILRSRGTKAFDTDLQVAPPQCTSSRPIFILLCVAKSVTLRSATTAAPLQRVYRFEGFLRRLTITVYGYVKQLEIRADSKVATNQNGLQYVEHYALKYSAASVKSENSIFFCYTWFFCDMLAYFIFPLSVSLPFIHPFCCSFIVFRYVLFLSFIALYSIFHASFPSVYLSFVYLTSYVPCVSFISILCLLRHLSLNFLCFLRSHVYLR
jgi:hypothetical protein